MAYITDIPPPEDDGAKKGGGGGKEKGKGGKSGECPLLRDFSPANSYFCSAAMADRCLISYVQS